MKSNLAGTKYGKTDVRMGNIFEGGMDLTVLPCSSKKTISSASRRWVELMGLVPPSEINGTLQLGNITKSMKYPGKKDITRNYLWAASVFNDATTFNAIEQIGAELGLLTQKRKTIRSIETPLLGTGAGGISNDESSKGLAQGFMKCSHPDATLHIFVFDRERFTNLERSLSEGKWGSMWESVQLKPGMFGVGIDLKKLLSKK